MSIFKFILNNKRVFVSIILVLFLLNITLLFYFNFNPLLKLYELILQITLIVSLIFLLIKFLKFKDNKTFTREIVDKKINNPLMPLQGFDELYPTNERFEKYYEEVIKILEDENLNQFNILINGQWGTGKSSFLNFLETKIKNTELKNKFEILKINLLGFYSTDDILFNLIREIGIYFRYPYWEEIFKIFKINFNLSYFSFNLTLDNDLSFERKIQDFKENIFKQLEHKKKKLLIILDEADRLSEAGQLISVMKFINIFSRIPYVYLLVAMDQRIFLDVFQGKEYIVRGYLNKTFDKEIGFIIPRDELNRLFYSKLKEFLSNE